MLDGLVRSVRRLYAQHPHLFQAAVAVALYLLWRAACRGDRVFGQQLPRFMCSEAKKKKEDGLQLPEGPAPGDYGVRGGYESERSRRRQR
jgi:hypothetical protein